MCSCGWPAVAAAPARAVGPQHAHVVVVWAARAMADGGSAACGGLGEAALEVEGGGRDSDEIFVGRRLPPSRLQSAFLGRQEARSCASLARSISPPSVRSVGDLLRTTRHVVGGPPVKAMLACGRTTVTPVGATPSLLRVSSMDLPLPPCGSPRLGHLGVSCWLVDRRQSSGGWDLLGWCVGGQ